MDKKNDLRYALQDYLEMRSLTDHRFNRRVVRILLNRAGSDLDSKVYSIPCFLFNKNLVVIRNGEPRGIDNLLVLDSKKNLSRVYGDFGKYLKY
ncbi:MAG: hypothetical protein PHE61_00585 [Candidatus Omnitrophica bacterium]|nr:hypothetical protein [Candidatus Omnitrophota bacterium]